MTEGWGNPPEAAGGALGLILPEGKTFLDGTWGAVVTYEATAYVSDEDAKSADYAKLLQEMKSRETEVSAERKKAGYGSVRLVGWAEAPSYDAQRHDLIWAREIQFGDEEDHTLNYDVRHLGRHGVLSLNMVSTMSELPSVRTGALDLAKTAEFETGARYLDFKKGDKTAGYGLAGLVAAGAGIAVAKKAGLIGLLLVLAKKGFVVIAAGFAAVVASFRRIFGRKNTAVARAAAETETTEAESDALREPKPTD